MPAAEFESAIPESDRPQTARPMGLATDKQVDLCNKQLTLFIATFITVLSL
jgi:hypothetical protein